MSILYLLNQIQRPNRFLFGIASMTAFFVLTLDTLMHHQLQALLMFVPNYL